MDESLMFGVQKEVPHQMRYGEIFERARDTEFPETEWGFTRHANGQNPDQEQLGNLEQRAL